MDEKDIPKLDLLIKMMKMTTAEDHVALVALRKANKLIHENGWDWEKILKGKVKIIEDPFKNVTMTRDNTQMWAPTRNPPAPPPPIRPTAAAPPPPPPPLRPAYSPNYNKPNPPRAQQRTSRRFRQKQPKPTTRDILDQF